MDEAFKQLEKDGQNTVKSLIIWLKEAKILIDQVGEEQIMRLLEKAEKERVAQDKFEAVLTQFAAETKTTLAELQLALMQNGQVFLSALEAGAEAFNKYLDTHEPPK